MKSKITNIYKKQAQGYAKFAPESFSWIYIEKPALENYLKPLLKKKIKILDAGCGSGRIIKLLINFGFKEENITGVDSSEEMVALARKNFSSKLNLIKSDLTENSFKEKTLDLITSSMVFQDLDDQDLKKVLANFSKWLKKGGILVYLVAHPLRVIQGNLQGYFNTGWINNKTPWGTTMPVYHRTIKNFINLTSEAGFRVESIDEPQVLKNGSKFPDEYKKYTLYPARLIVKALKS